MSDGINIDGKHYSSKQPFIVAEIGINHNGDMTLAKETIAAAAEAGADSVKFQNYYTEDFIYDKSLIITYESQGNLITEPQYNLFKRCEISIDQLALLKEEAEKCGLNFHSTPTSIKGINDLIDINCTLLKNGSDFLTNLRLIEQMGNTGLLTVLSTGMATISEIDEAVQTFRKTGNDKLVLLHCTSAYPTPEDEVNLTRIKMLRDLFNVPTGFSDHTDGIVAAILAVSFGTCWIEKHFTLNKSLPGPDHKFSMDPNELKSLVSKVRSAEKMIGSPYIGPTNTETINRDNFRLSCIAKRNIPVNIHISNSDITFNRPGTGIPPSKAESIIGKKTKRAISEGELFDLTMFY